MINSMHRSNVFAQSLVTNKTYLFTAIKLSYCQHFFDYKLVIFFFWKSVALWGEFTMTFLLIMFKEQLDLSGNGLLLDVQVFPGCSKQPVQLANGVKFHR